LNHLLLPTENNSSVWSNLPHTSVPILAYIGCSSIKKHLEISKAAYLSFSVYICKNEY